MRSIKLEKLFNNINKQTLYNFIYENFLNISFVKYRKLSDGIPSYYDGNFRKLNYTIDFKTFDDDLVNNKVKNTSFLFEKEEYFSPLSF